VALFTRKATVPLESEKEDDDRERLAKQQANAGVALLRLKQADPVWPLLQHRSDPRTRSYLIHRLRPLGVDATTIFQRLGQEQEVSIRRALLLCLGELGLEKLPADDQKDVLKRVENLYRDDPDPGIHGASKWLLRKWEPEEKRKGNDLEKKLQSIDKELATGQVEGKRGWYLNG